MGTLGSLVLIVASAYLVFVLVVYLQQGRLLYLPELPSRSLMATPAAIGLPFEDVTLVTEDGVRVHGWFVAAPHDTQQGNAVLFFHGNAGNISHRLDSLRIFHALGLASLIIDYRGYGRSAGKPNEAGTYHDARAAWQYMVERRGYAAHQLIYFGRSLGAAVAAQLATQYPPAALIMESAFTSVPDMAADVYPFLPGRWLSRFDYNAEANLRGLSCPVLVVHSPDDEIIPFRHGRKLFEAVAGPKQFLELRGGHNEGFLVSGDRYVQGLRQFLAQWVRPDSQVTGVR